MRNRGGNITENEKLMPLSAYNAGRYGMLFAHSAVFVVSVSYFILFGSHIFAYQDNQILFVYSGDYLNQYLSKTGGLLEYAGNFLAQVYFRTPAGSLLLASLFTLTAFVFFKIGQTIYGKGPFLMPLMVLPSCILMVLQSDFNFRLYNNLGFLFSSVYFLLIINSSERRTFLALFLLFPLFYWFAGGYIWIFAGMYIIYSLLNRNIIYPLILAIFSLITVFIFRKVIFIQPLDELLFYPLSSKSYLRLPELFYLVCALFIFYPLLMQSLKRVKLNLKEAGAIHLYMVIVIFSATIFTLSKLNKPDISNLFKLEDLVRQEKWEEAIKLQEKLQMKNIIAQYYYNLALSETGQLCDRMFFSRQDYGPRSLMVQWDSRANINQIFRGAYFFYNIGLINEAHRWAFESMVMQGYRPENINMLIKTELINGNYKIASKYIHVLKHTLRFKYLAEKYEAMIENPELLMKDPDMAEKISLRKGDDFLIRLKDQQANVILLLKSNPGNARAYEYMMAWFLLERNTGEVAKEIKTLTDLGYNRIPGHIEEAALVFRSVTGELPNLGALKISPETEKRFVQFISSAGNPENIAAARTSALQKTFGNTFWFYNEYK